MKINDDIFKESYFYIKNSNLFNEKWFLKQYYVPPETDPISYYLLNCISMHLNPSPKFDTKWYLNEYPDVEKSGMNAFAHYIAYGKDAYRLPLPYKYDPKYKKDYSIIYNSEMFDETWFYEKYEIPSDIDPIIFFLENCEKQQLNPSPKFDTKWYLNEYPDVKKSGENPLIYFIIYGKNKGHIPKAYTFNELEKLNLRHSIRGKNNYYFLINDTNNELKQHYDDTFTSKFNYEKFNQDLNNKKEYFRNQGIGYYYFIVPDKSIICKNLLPIKYNSIIRNVDKINVLDFNKELNEYCYWEKDSHQNIEGGKKFSYHILNHIDTTLTKNKYKDLVKECDFTEINETCDLIHYLNWSYSNLEKKEIKINKVLFPIPKDIQYLNIPKKFAKDQNRISEHIYNPNSYSNLKALIFRDSSTTPLKHYLSLYFREIFFYWDHLNLNKELIEWYNPDILIEIRIERFIENYIAPNWINELNKTK
ncbi:hypothetical protein [uncultured Methanobrevibacter sp.]|uniref:hypothetical protein n=1 Tax=uncultured Methanobrevibacter sp. TaxID=253161 RepID=UPI0025D692D1|nr:hypothetical protein [uncultured Methanobrevibacter sp.]